MAAFPGKEILMNDMLKTVSLVSKLFEITENPTGKKNSKSVNEWQKKFFEKVPGISFPDDWDQLSEKEKKKRLDKVIDLGLDKKGERK
jgi:hypothetical protein|tara:strand:+ start:1947 stop:2210 length:264 start_codon:yes stop_codon:yes gene_type:complete